MTPDPLDEVSRVYHAALERAAGERRAFLEGGLCRKRGPEARGGVPVGLRGRRRGLHRSACAAGGCRRRSGPSAVMTGRHIGSYTVQALIDAGGMGEVYRARDTKLGRDVAIKVLPPAFMADPARRARFEREARLLATLNHPNIAQIYGLEESDGAQALVMELVPGETLAAADWFNGPRHQPNRWTASGAFPGRVAVHRAADGGRGRSGAREGHAPPRSEAGQHQGHSRRRGQGARLRTRQGVRGRSGARGESKDLAHARGHRRRRHSGDGRLHEPRAGARTAGRQAHRHLGVRLRALRDADRSSRVRGADADRHPGSDSRARARLGGTAGDDTVPGARAPGALPGQGSEAASA